MYDRDRDHATMVDWCDAHGSVAAPAAFLPPLGVVVERGDKELAMLFLYYSLSCPVAFVDNAVTRPKLSLKESVDALSFAFAYLNNEAQANGYAVIVAHVSPSLAKFMGRCGFNTQQEGLVRMFASTDSA